MIIRGRGDVWRPAAGSAASNTGNWAATVALALVVYARTGSAVWLSASFLFTQVPSALAAPLSGMIADRLDRKRTMIICDLLGGGGLCRDGRDRQPAGIDDARGDGGVAALAVWPGLAGGRPEPGRGR